MDSNRGSETTPHAPFSGQEICRALVLMGFCLSTIYPAAAQQACRDAQRAFNSGRWQEARTEFENCENAGGTGPELFSSLGSTYARLGEFDNALKAYGRALQLSPGNPSILANIGLAHLKSAHFEEAAGKLAEALRLQPDNLRVEELLAFCHFQLGRYDEARQEAEHVHQAQPDSASAAFLLGSVYVKQQTYDAAVPLIEFALNRVGSAEGHALLGEAYLGSRKYTEALGEFKVALALKSDIPRLRYNLGLAYAGLGQTDAAIAELAAVFDHDSTDFDVVYQLGRLKRIAGDPPAAAEFLDRAHRLRPDDLAVKFECAVLALESRNFPQAELLLKEVVSAAPNQVRAHILLSELYFKTHLIDQAKHERQIVEDLRLKPPQN